MCVCVCVCVYIHRHVCVYVCINNIHIFYIYIYIYTYIYIGMCVCIYIHMHCVVFNDNHRQKLCFTQFSTRMAARLLLTFPICLHNQLSYIYIPYHILRAQMFEKCDSSNRQ